MKRYLAGLIAIILILSSISSFPVFAEDNVSDKPLDWYFENSMDVNKAVDVANAEIGFKYYDINKVNKETYGDYKALAYGSPWGVDKAGGFRYLGLTPDNDDIPNHKSPMDSWAGGYLDDRKWIKEPWNHDLCERSMFDYHPKQTGENGEPIAAKWEKHIIKTMEEKYSGKDGKKAIWKGTFKNWYQYVHIIQPSDYTAGSLIGWHTSRAKLRELI